MLPFWIWYLFFTYMPHKEERFMFVIYPFIALNASITITQFRLFKIDNLPSFIINIINCKGILFNWILPNIKVFILGIFVILCTSRTFGQV